MKVMITLYVRQQWRHRCIEQSFVSVGVGKGRMIWENSIETCKMSYVKWIASPGLMHEIGCSGLVHWDDPEGWDWEGGVRGLRMGNTCTLTVDSGQCMAKPIQYYKVK